MMNLTREESIALSKDLWTWLLETGKDKHEWPEWKKYGYDIQRDCFLCEYGRDTNKPLPSACQECPYYQKFGPCYREGKPFDKWDNVITPKIRKKYAGQFLEQLNQL